LFGHKKNCTLLLDGRSGLLQRAELVVLDESFAALDPESLRQALDCVLGRARTLMVIAHP
jgi:ABC-type multidrug transport system fused ATPase/permease subunit